MFQAGRRFAIVLGFENKILQNIPMTERRPEERGINLEYESLEALLMDSYDDFITTLDECVEEMPYGNAFIDKRIEQEFSNLNQYTDVMANAVAGEAACGDARQAGYRAFHFAHFVSSMLLSANPQLYVGEFFGNESEEELRDKLDLSVAGYLEERHTLKWLISRFTSEMDPSGKYSDVVENVAGSTFMFIDACERERAIQAEVDAFAAELEAL